MFSESKLFIKKETTLTGSMRHGEILQRALTTLIADRTIQWVRCEQKFDCAFLSDLRLVRLRQHHHALFHLIRAGGFEFGHELNLRCTILHHELTGGAIAHRASDFHETHAAHANWFKFGMMTEDRDINTDHLSGISQPGPIRNGYLFSINSKRDLFTHETCTTLSKSCLKRSMLVTTAVVEKSPSAHKHLPWICFATFKSKSTSAW